MNRNAWVYVDDQKAGKLTQGEGGFVFAYDEWYRSSPTAQPVSLTLPLSKDKYESAYLFPFFDGLIPEGYLLEIAARKWGLNPLDRMGLLLRFGKDAIGNVSVVEVKDE